MAYIASLPMYDRPELHDAHDALWSAIRDQLLTRGIEAPQRLARDRAPFEGWAHPNLLLGQICNLPYRAQFRHDVSRVSTPVCLSDGDEAGYYHSVIITHKDSADTPIAELACGAFAYNDSLSQSGWGAPFAWAEAQRIRLNPTLRTGSHLQSLRAVANKSATMAGIDSVTFALQLRFDPETEDVVVIARTAPTPGMTYITRQHHLRDEINGAVSTAVSGLSAEVKSDLRLSGVIDMPDQAYQIPLPKDVSEIRSFI